MLQQNKYYITKNTAILYNYWYFVIATFFGLSLGRLQTNVHKLQSMRTVYCVLCIAYCVLCIAYCVLCIVPLTKELWHEDGLKKDRIICHNKTPVII